MSIYLSKFYDGDNDNLIGLHNYSLEAETECQKFLFLMNMVLL